MRSVAKTWFKSFDAFSNVGLSGHVEWLLSEDRHALRSSHHRTSLRPVPRILVILLLPVHINPKPIFVLQLNNPVEPVVLQVSISVPRTLALLVKTHG